MMRFLANENFPFPSMKILRTLGFEVKHIGEDNFGISDEEVLKMAVAEKRIILTFDSDYGELIFKYKMEPPPAVVFFRLKGDNPKAAAQILLERMNNGALIINNYFTVIDEDGTRQRRLS
jgi:predicted nuclease of predicted toxin-antitoxin system